MERSSAASAGVRRHFIFQVIAKTRQDAPASTNFISTFGGNSNDLGDLTASASKSGQPAQWQLCAPMSDIEANFASARKPTLRLTTLEVVVAPEAVTP